MRVISLATLREFWRRHARAERPLRRWYKETMQAAWADFAEVRRTFPSADQVAVESGRIVTVFNISGNEFRLIAAIHYNRQCVFALRVLTHPEYDRGDWKRQL